MFYYISRFVVGIYFYLAYRIKISGAENLPKKGGFVLCSNHTSVNDPMVLGVTLKRQICFLGKKELFKKKFYGLVLKGLKVIPLDRGAADMTAYKTTLARLKEGRGIGVFAQGTRVKEFETKEAKAGVALFAYKGGVPIIPVCVTATYKRFSKVFINIGKPIHLDEYKGMKLKTDQLSAITEKVMEEISALRIADK